MQYHYVVCYDGQTDSWYVDVDTAMVVFHESPVFDTDTQEWVHEPELEVADCYAELEDALASLLNWAQGK